MVIYMKRGGDMGSSGRERVYGMEKSCDMERVGMERVVW